MTSRKTRSWTRLVAVAATATALAAVPMAASAAGAHSQMHQVASSRQQSANHAYNKSLFSHVNSARISDARHAYKHNRKVRHIAHRWAKHLAATGVLQHNPNLVAEVTKACPNWTSLGENVGVEGGTSANQLFTAYMNSPEHRANILDPQYTILGIATVSVTQDGQTTQWNVMDFANGCGK